MWDEIKKWYSKPTPPIQQYFLAFLSGVLLGPFSAGIAIFILWVLVYEIFYYYVCPKWNWQTRLLVFLISIVGWLLSRYLVLHRTGLGTVLGKWYLFDPLDYLPKSKSSMQDPSVIFIS